MEDLLEKTVEFDNSQHLFTLVPSEILRVESFSNLSKLVYVSILSFADTDNICRSEFRVMAEQLNSTEDQIKEAVYYLYEAGWIDISTKRNSKGDKVSELKYYRVLGDE